MRDNILNHWKEEELIGLNCLLKADGTVIILNCYEIKNEKENSYFSFPLCETTVDSLEKFNSDIWSQIEIFTEQHKTKEGGLIFGGEGNMGNEGFIACTDQGNQLNWALFFTNSNPFFKIELEDDKINAFTSSDLKYIIDVNSPEKISIISDQWRE